MRVTDEQFEDALNALLNTGGNESARLAAAINALPDPAIPPDRLPVPGAATRDDVAEQLRQSWHPMGQPGGLDDSYTRENWRRVADKAIELLAHRPATDVVRPAMCTLEQAQRILAAVDGRVRTPEAARLRAVQLRDAVNAELRPASVSVPQGEESSLHHDWVTRDDHERLHGLYTAERAAADQLRTELTAANDALARVRVTLREERAEFAAYVQEAEQNEEFQSLCEQQRGELDKLRAELEKTRAELEETHVKWQGINNRHVAEKEALREQHEALRAAADRAVSAYYDGSDGNEQDASLHDLRALLKPAPAEAESESTMCTGYQEPDPLDAVAVPAEAEPMAFVAYGAPGGACVYLDAAVGVQHPPPEPQLTQDDAELVVDDLRDWCKADLPFDATALLQTVNAVVAGRSVRMLAGKSREWWLAKARAEGASEVGAGMLHPPPESAMVEQMETTLEERVELLESALRLVLASMAGHGDPLRWRAAGRALEALDARKGGAK